MEILVLGLIIFFGIHLIPSLVGFRTKIIDRIGAGPYLGLYSIFALLGLILIIYGKSQASYQLIWQPPLWSSHLVFVIMLLSFFFMVAGDIKSNVKRHIRHPMLLGVGLWSGAHLFANGDLASIMLFASFFIFSVFDIMSANLRGASYQDKKYPFYRVIIIAVVTVVFYLVFIKYLHPLLIGVAII